jgi:hypothetical protein
LLERIKRRPNRRESTEYPPGPTRKRTVVMAIENVQ